MLEDSNGQVTISGLQGRAARSARELWQIIESARGQLEGGSQKQRFWPAGKWDKPKPPHTVAFKSNRM